MHKLTAAQTYTYKTLTAAQTHTHTRIDRLSCISRDDSLSNRSCVGYSSPRFNIFYVPLLHFYGHVIQISKQLKRQELLWAVLKEFAKIFFFFLHEIPTWFSVTDLRSHNGALLKKRCSPPPQFVFSLTLCRAGKKICCVPTILKTDAGKWFQASRPTDLLVFEVREEINRRRK